jgi:predicted PhzF superfamily epimerase YddE/YHI9
VTVSGTIRAIDEIDSDVARRIFGSSAAVALGGWPGATTGRAWASSAGFAEDVATGAIADDVRVVMYDPEHWDATPQRNDSTRGDPSRPSARSPEHAGIRSW